MINILRLLAIRKESTSVVIEISTLAPGLYFLEIQDTEGRKLGNTPFSKF